MPSPAESVVPRAAAVVRIKEPSGVQFRDVAQAAGLNYRFVIAGPRPLNILQTIGNGCAFLDYDQDGNLDVLLVGNPMPKLFRGNGKGQFREVGSALGFAPQLPKVRGAAWLGCAVGDVDNDGFPEIYLSGYRTGAFFKNEGGKRLREIGAQSGLPLQDWGSSCGFSDLDGDGRLDLVIANYLDFGFDPKLYKVLCRDPSGVFTSCSPMDYYSKQTRFFRNVGGARFKELLPSKSLISRGKGLGVAFSDYDGDGDSDVYIANDTTPGDLFQNDGRARFREAGVPAGVALAPGNRLQSGMGADWGDYDNDGRLDLIVATFDTEMKALYHNEGAGAFRHVSENVGLRPESAPYVTFGAKWLDCDNDGWLDLMLSNGHIQDNVSQMRPKSVYRQPTLLFRNREQGVGKRQFVEVSAQTGAALQKPIVGRGLATGDYDNDGRVDALVVDAEGAPLLLHNESPKSASGNWIGFALTGDKSMNRDANGALLTVSANGRKWVRQCQPSGSYLSQSDARVHFGLGQASGPVTLSVRWPNGKRESWRKVPINGYLALSPGARPHALETPSRRTHF